MAGYSSDLTMADYLYMEKIVVTEKSGFDQTDISILLDLDSSNFNFELIRNDGADIRLAEKSGGTYVLFTWIEECDVSNNVGKIWFKIPSLLASEEKDLYVIWGNTTDSGISDVDEVGLLFGDPFIGGSQDVSKWSGNTTLGDPFSGVKNWMVEIKTQNIFTNGTITFNGTENNFATVYYDTFTYIQHNFVDNSTYVQYDDLGLEQTYSHTISFAYYEPDDKLYYTIAGRGSLEDMDDSWEHEAHGDIRLISLNISSLLLEKVIIRNYLGPNKEPQVDTSDLYVGYEQVPPQNLDFNTYQGDLTSITYIHTSTSVSGTGDPYKLSDNLYDADGYIWKEGVTEPGVNLTINFAAKGSNLVSRTFTHYDDTHVLYKGAAKLSDNDVDVNQNTYWQGTTTSGYACIDFEDYDYKIGIILVRGLSSSLGGMVKNYTIDGSQVSPLLSEEDDWTNLHSGQLQQLDEWQMIRFTNTTIYRYYRLKVLDTYGDNITLREWEMYNYTAGLTEKNVRQLRLKPANFDSNETYYPKYVSFYGGTLSGTWDELISCRKTYTPYYEGPYSYWQRYSFSNSEDYWLYKLTVSGNWGGYSGAMKLAEWEMREML